LRLRPQALHRLGWHYVRVHTFELFANPDRVAQRIARLTGVIESDEPESDVEDSRNDAEHAAV